MSLQTATSENHIAYSTNREPSQNKKAGLDGDIKNA
jgi:hypothetical protein